MYAMDTICERVKQRREQLGLSVAEVAKRASVSESLVQMIERGIRGRDAGGVTKTGAATAFALADALECDARWLVLGAPKRTRRVA